MKNSSQRGPSEAFTLVELLVAIAVVSILAGLLTPSLTSTRRAALATQCISNQRQILLSAAFYMNGNDDYLVRSRYYRDPDGNEKTWPRALAPYVGGAGAVFLCPEVGPAELPAVFSDDWDGRDLLNVGINRNLETVEGRADKWLKEQDRPRRIGDFSSPSQTWYFADSFCGARGFQCRLGRQIDGQSSFSTRHDGRVQLGFLDGHVKAYAAELLTDAAGITIDDNPAGVWWFPRQCPPEWMVP